MADLGTALGMSATIGMLTFFMVVLIDMFSRAFGFQNAMLWVKSEYAQVAVTFLIILSAASMLTVGNEIVSKVSWQVASASGNVYVGEAANHLLTTGMPLSPAELGKSYIEMVVGCERVIYAVAYWINIFIEMTASLTVDIVHVEAIGGGLVRTPITTFLQYIMGNIRYLVLYHYIQYNLLLFSQYSMLQVFLPIGLALRAFPFTRGVGGFMTAFALGFAFVFPMTYAIIISIMPTADTMCKTVDLTTNPGFMLFKDERPCFNNRANVVHILYKVASEKDKIEGTADYIKRMIGLLYLQALFYPLAALIVTISFIRQTGNLFGADLAEIGRGLIKLI
ncbi:MAG: hypothetical protein N3G22_03065 [Candidatus Micrarchaeota archaeon]|nr:hypothetical protein [Candidatus Micrarchaeota archaeon]